MHVYKRVFTCARVCVNVEICALCVCVLCLVVVEERRRGMSFGYGCSRPMW